jgi:hypothetical protein
MLMAKIQGHKSKSLKHPPVFKDNGSILLPLQAWIPHLSQATITAILILFKVK